MALQHKSDPEFLVVRFRDHKQLDTHAYTHTHTHKHTHTQFIEDLKLNKLALFKNLHCRHWLC